VSDSEGASEFYERQKRFKDLSQTEQVLRAAWYVQSVKCRDRFQPKDITDFFASLHLDPPNVHVNIKRLHDRKPKLLLWDRRGYFLEGNCRRKLDDDLKVVVDPVAHVTSESLKSISDQITEASQRTFLAETLNCYRVGAFRATIVMAWSLAFDHFQTWIVSDAGRLAAFNMSVATKYPKKPHKIGSIDDFATLKEFEAIESAQHAKLITKNVGDVMREKLKRRNAAAHPSSVVFTQAQADDAITDLVHNVIARLN